MRKILGIPEIETECCIDLSNLDQLPSEILKTIVQLYLEKLPTFETSMRNAFKEQNHKNISRLAHKFRSSSGVIGATRLVSLLKKLENIENIKSIETGELLQRIRRECRKIKTTLTTVVYN